MSTRIHVGNLSYSTTDAGLKDAFAKFGAVEDAVVISDKMTGRSRGFGFVTMADAGEAGKAIESMNGQDLDGRKLTVNEARPREDRPSSRGGY